MFNEIDTFFMQRVRQLPVYREEEQGANWNIYRRKSSYEKEDIIICSVCHMFDWLQQ